MGCESVLLQSANQQSPRRLKASTTAQMGSPTTTSHQSRSSKKAGASQIHEHDPDECPKRPSSSGQNNSRSTSPDPKNTSSIHLFNDSTSNKTATDDGLNKKTVAKGDDCCSDNDKDHSYGIDDRQGSDTAINYHKDNNNSQRTDFVRTLGFHGAFQPVITSKQHHPVAGTDDVDCENSLSLRLKRSNLMDTDKNDVMDSDISSDNESISYPHESIDGSSPAEPGLHAVVARAPKSATEIRRRKRSSREAMKLTQQQQQNDNSSGSPASPPAVDVVIKQSPIKLLIPPLAHPLSLHPGRHQQQQVEADNDGQRDQTTALFLGFDHCFSDNDDAGEKASFVDDHGTIPKRHRSDTITDEEEDEESGQEDYSSSPEQRRPALNFEKMRQRLINNRRRLSGVSKQKSSSTIIRRRFTGGENHHLLQISSPNGILFDKVTSDNFCRFIPIQDDRTFSNNNTAMNSSTTTAMMTAENRNDYIFRPIQLPNLV